MEETNAKKERRTQKAMDVKTNDNISIDRFSDLPEHMIHQIVSLVPVKYATRTSVLSKRFRSAWLSNPVIEFNVNFFAHSVSYRKATQRLMDFVGDTLKRRDTKANLQKLTFRGNLDDTTFKVPVRSMINYALDKQVEELYLHGNVNGNLDGTLLLSGLCSLPKVMFFAKSIKVLEIEGFKIQAQNFILSCPLIEKFRLSCCVGLKSIRASGAQELKVVELEWCTGLEKIDIDALNLESLSYTGRNPLQPCEIVMTNCNSLRKLSLRCSTIMDQWLHYHVSRFHFLEILNLFGCPTLKYISVSHPNIKEIKLYNCVGVEKIDIVAQNLQSFTYGVLQSRQCNINISACKYLRNLSLYNATITDRWVEDNMAVLCLLKTLRLECCNVLEKIKFHHDLLTCFELHDCKVVEAEIDAPNLSSFVYSGQLMLPPVITSSHWDAMIKLNTNLHNQQDPPSEWFTSLREFLLGFGTCNLLTLVCNNEKVTILYNFYILNFSFTYFLLIIYINIHT